MCMLKMPIGQDELLGACSKENAVRGGGGEKRGRSETTQPGRNVFHLDQS